MCIVWHAVAGTCCVRRQCWLSLCVCAPADVVILALQIVINRPHKRNAFTPLTVREMSLCFADARDDPAIGVIVLTGTP